VYFGEDLTFRRNIPPPSSRYKRISNKKPAEAGGKIRLLISSLVYTSTLKMEAIWSTETSGSFSELYGVTTVKAVFFIVTALRSSEQNMVALNSRTVIPFSFQKT
jgi:hypothetical protein